MVCVKGVGNKLVNQYATVEIMTTANVIHCRMVIKYQIT
jgi:hypothetical protein